MQGQECDLVLCAAEGKNMATVGDKSQLLLALEYYLLI